MVSHSESSNPQRSLGWEDLAVLGLLVSFIYAVVMIAKEWAGPMLPVSELHTEPGYLPLYALFSLTRGVCAYGISLLFTLGYGYIMARVDGAERFMLPVLDILQSIPVLGFLPGFVLSLVHLFPHRNFGLELASVLMIFTGQAWNMTFSFYASLKSLPPNLVAVAQLAKLTWWQRFTRLDLSFAATGLVWNSMMSMAGGWFFLSVSEAFVLGDHDFRLPGLGSYMSLAIERGDTKAQWMGALTMLAMIVFLDQVVWRPIVDWSQKFTEEESQNTHPSWILKRLRGASFLSYALAPFVVLSKFTNHYVQRLKLGRMTQSRKFKTSKRWLKRGLAAVAISMLFYGLVRYVWLIGTLTRFEWAHLLLSTLATLCRVATAVILATAWTIPAGVMIGRNPQWSRWLQPAIQMAASFPAPMLFPLVVGGLLHAGIGLGLSSVVLLMLGTQWYVLFNVIAGTSAIPKELWEVARLGHFSWVCRWKTLILPAIFPALLTGWITAMGGAWNASIVAEYMKLNGTTLATSGLGAAISQATEHGNFHVLAAAVGLMAIVVTGFNRLVWHPLSHKAQNRFAMTY